jgi:hypothetical protein
MAEKVPMIPVAAAEILYVAMDHILTHIDKHGEYPKHMSDDMRRVLGTYHKVRSNAMAHRGHDAMAVRRYTETAQRSLAQWMNLRAAKSEELEGHFDQWKEELGDRQSNQGE